MRYEYRISKYDPKGRDESGRYTRAEWTQFAQVGAVTGRKKLTLSEYRRVENAYLQTISDMLLEAGISRVNVARFRALRQASSAVKKVRTGTAIDLRTLIQLSRMALRDLADVALNSPRRMYLHFGFDYYVYLGLSKPTPSAISSALRRRIFVEQMPSPYRVRKAGARQS